MVKEFNEFEEKYNLFDLAIDDFELWAYIRFEMYFKIGESFGITNGTGSTPPAGIKDKLCLIRNTFINNPYRSIKKYDVLIIPHQRRVLENGKYKCIYTDDVASNLRCSNITAEFLFGMTHFKPAETSRLIYLDYIDIIPAVKYKLNIYDRKKRAIKDVAQMISSAIEEFFSVTVSEESIRKLIQKRYYWHKYKKPLIQKLLKKIQPKVIIEVIGYETNKMIINEVAQEMGIHCVELQHGVIGKGHIAYNYGIKKRLKQFPEFLFVYSQYWKNTCSFPIGGQNIIATGFPYMENQIRKYPKNTNEDGQIRIIVYSSTDSTEPIQKFTEEVMALLDQFGYNYKIVYKLHPLEYSLQTKIWDKIKQSSKVDFIDTPNKSLYELCSYSDVQIGVKTTAVFEGLSYGLKTFILNTGAPDIEYYMGDLVNMGYAIYGNNAADFCKFIEDELSLNSKIQEDKASFFVEDSLNNICQEINRVIAYEG